MKNNLQKRLTVYHNIHRNLREANVIIVERFELIEMGRRYYNFGNYKREGRKPANFMGGIHN